jgi:PKD domain/Secretion system C-terminal sorting domain
MKWLLILLIYLPSCAFCQVNDPYILLGTKENPSGTPHPINRYLLDFRGNDLQIDTLNLPIAGYVSVIGGIAGTGQVVSRDSLILFYSNGSRLVYPDGTIVLNADSLWDLRPDEGFYAPYYLLSLTDSIYMQVHTVHNGTQNTNCPFAYCMDHFYHKFGVNQQTNEVKVLEKRKYFMSSWNMEISQPVRHANGQDWWFCHLNGTNFSEPFHHQLWRVTPDTVVKTNAEFVHNNPFIKMGRGLSYTQKGYSLDGSKYYWCETPGCLVFDFDRCTGSLSNMQVIQAPADQSYQQSFTYFGAQLSPNNRFLYATFTQRIEPVGAGGDATQINDYLLQYDLFSDDITTSVDTIAVSDSIYYPGYPWYRKGQDFHSLSYAPDGQLWMPSGFNSLSLIQYPDSLGQACGFVSRFVDEVTINYTDFRQANHRLGPIDGSPCDTLGINNDPRAQYFWKSDDCLNVRFRNTSWHEPTSFLWDFGDGTTSTEREPVHTYVTKAIYTVCLTVSNLHGSSTFCRELNLITCGSSSTQTTPQPDGAAFGEMIPNPTSGPLQLRYRLHPNRYDGALRIYDTAGREVLARSLRVNETSYLFSIEHLSAGLYFWSLTDGAGLVSSGKVVKIE